MSMIAIRQFLESLALGLGVGLVLVVYALFALESKEPVRLEPRNGPSAVSSPTTQPGLRRDEDGVPLRLGDQLEMQGARAG
jgi:hypothetical protein